MFNSSSCYSTLVPYSVTEESQLLMKKSLKKNLKCENKCSLLSSNIVGLFCMYFKSLGTASEKVRSTLWLLLYSLFITLDLILLEDIITEIFFADFSNSRLKEVGRLLLFIYFGLPMFTSVLSVFGAFRRDLLILKEMQNWNAYIILVNGPLLTGACAWFNEDP